MGFLVAERLPATYESEATLLVGPVSGDRETLQASGTQARTYAGIAQTATILNRAAREVGLTPRSVESKLDVTASDITRLITIRARDGEAVRAAEIANSTARALTDYANRQGLATPAEGRLTIVERAVPSTNEIGPSKDLILPLAAIAGLLGAPRRWVTIIEGEGSAAAATRHITEWLSEHRPDVSSEVHHGGQPLYPYLFGVE